MKSKNFHGRDTSGVISLCSRSLSNQLGWNSPPNTKLDIWGLWLILSHKCLNDLLHSWRLTERENRIETQANGDDGSGHNNMQQSSYISDPTIRAKDLSVAYLKADLFQIRQLPLHTRRSVLWIAVSKGRRSHCNPFLRCSLRNSEICDVVIRTARKKQRWLSRHQRQRPYYTYRLYLPGRAPIGCM